MFFKNKSSMIEVSFNMFLKKKKNTLLYKVCTTCPQNDFCYSYNVAFAKF